MWGLLFKIALILALIYFVVLPLFNTGNMYVHRQIQANYWWMKP